MTTDEQKELKRLAGRVWYQQNREKLLAKQKAYYQAHAEERKEYQRQYDRKKKYGKN